MPAAPPLGDRPLAWACRPSRGRQGPVCNKNIYNQTSGDLFVIKIFTHRLGGRSPVPRATGEAGRPPIRRQASRVVVSWLFGPVAGSLLQFGLSKTNGEGALDGCMRLL